MTDSWGLGTKVPPPKLWTRGRRNEASEYLVGKEETFRVTVSLTE